MSINWKRNQPVIHHLRNILPKHFPIFLTIGLAKHSSGIGGYVARERRQGGISAHSSGCAADIFLLASNPVHKMLGDALMDLFGRHRVAFGVDHVIWNGRIRSSASPNGRAIIPANDRIGMHRNHVHVAFTEDGSQRHPPGLEAYLITLRADLDRRLEAQDRAGWAQADTDTAAPTRFGSPSPFSMASDGIKEWISPYGSLN